MAKRKSKVKQEEEFLNALFGLVCFGGLFGSYYLTKSWGAAIIVTVILFALLIAILTIRKQQRAERLRKSGIADIDKMDGRQFEHYLGHLFRSQGYAVKVTRAAGDYGADLVLQKGGEKIVVQAKRYSKSVGIDAVQQVHSSKSYYGAQKAWVLSNREYTEAARNLAKTNGVRLIGRDELIEMILKMNPVDVPKPKQIIESSPSPTEVCNRCGKPMILRKGPKGEFFGCSAYPKCRNVKEVPS